MCSHVVWCAASLLQVVVESVENIETVVAFGLEPRFYGRFKTKTVKPYR